MLSSVFPSKPARQPKEDVEWDRDRDRGRDRDNDVAEVRAAIQSTNPTLTQKKERREVSNELIVTLRTNLPNQPPVLRKLLFNPLVRIGEKAVEELMAAQSGISRVFEEQELFTLLLQSKHNRRYATLEEAARNLVVDHNIRIMLRTLYSPPRVLSVRGQQYAIADMQWTTGDWKLDVKPLTPIPTAASPADRMRIEQSNDRIAKEGQRRLEHLDASLKFGANFREARLNPAATNNESNNNNSSSSNPFLSWFNDPDAFARDEGGSVTDARLSLAQAEKYILLDPDNHFVFDWNGHLYMGNRTWLVQCMRDPNNLFVLQGVPHVNIASLFHCNRITNADGSDYQQLLVPLVRMKVAVETTSVAAGKMPASIEALMPTQTPRGTVSPHYVQVRYRESDAALQRLQRIASADAPAFVMRAQPASDYLVPDAANDVDPPNELTLQDLRAAPPARTLRTVGFVQEGGEGNNDKKNDLNEFREVWCLSDPAMMRERGNVVGPITFSIHLRPSTAATDADAADAAASSTRKKAKALFVSPADIEAFRAALTVWLIDHRYARITPWLQQRSTFADVAGRARIRCAGLHLTPADAMMLVGLAGDSRFLQWQDSGIAIDRVELDGPNIVRMRKRIVSLILTSPIPTTFLSSSTLTTGTTDLRSGSGSGADAGASTHLSFAEWIASFVTRALKYCAPDTAWMVPDTTIWEEKQVRLSFAFQQSTGFADEEVLCFDPVALQEDLNQSLTALARAEVENAESEAAESADDRTASALLTEWLTATRGRWIDVVAPLRHPLLLNEAQGRWRDVRLGVQFLGDAPPTNTALSAVTAYLTSIVEPFNNPTSMTAEQQQEEDAQDAAPEREMVQDTFDPANPHRHVYQFSGILPSTALQDMLLLNDGRIASIQANLLHLVVASSPSSAASSSVETQEPQEPQENTVDCVPQLAAYLQPLRVECVFAPKNSDVRRAATLLSNTTMPEWREWMSNGVVQPMLRQRYLRAALWPRSPQMLWLQKVDIEVRAHNNNNNDDNNDNDNGDGDEGNRDTITCTLHLLCSPDVHEVQHPWLDNWVRTMRMGVTSQVGPERDNAFIQSFTLLYTRAHLQSNAAWAKRKCSVATTAASLGASMSDWIHLHRNLATIVGLPPHAGRHRIFLEQRAITAHSSQWDIFFDDTDIDLQHLAVLRYSPEQTKQQLIAHTGLRLPEDDDNMLTISLDERIFESRHRAATRRSVRMVTITIPVTLALSAKYFETVYAVQYELAMATKSAVKDVWFAHVVVLRSNAAPNANPANPFAATGSTDPSETVVAWTLQFEVPRKKKLDQVMLQMALPRRLQLAEDVASGIRLEDSTVDAAADAAATMENPSAERARGPWNVRQDAVFQKLLQAYRTPIPSSPQPPPRSEEAPRLSIEGVECVVQFRHPLRWSSEELQRAARRLAFDVLPLPSLRNDADAMVQVAVSVPDNTVRIEVRGLAAQWWSLAAGDMSLANHLNTQFTLQSVRYLPTQSTASATAIQAAMSTQEKQAVQREAMASFQRTLRQDMMPLTLEVQQLRQLSTPAKMWLLTVLQYSLVSSSSSSSSSADSSTGSTPSLSLLPPLLRHVQRFVHRTPVQEDTWDQMNRAEITVLVDQTAVIDVERFQRALALEPLFRDTQWRISPDDKVLLPSTFASATDTNTATNTNNDARWIRIADAAPAADSEGVVSAIPSNPAVAAAAPIHRPPVFEEKREFGVPIANAYHAATTQPKSGNIEFACDLWFQETHPLNAALLSASAKEGVHADEEKAKEEEDAKPMSTSNSDGTDVRVPTGSHGSFTAQQQQTFVALHGDNMVVQFLVRGLFSVSQLAVFWTKRRLRTIVEQSPSAFRLCATATEKEKEKEKEKEQTDASNNTTTTTLEFGQMGRSLVDVSPMLRFYRADWVAKVQPATSISWFAGTSASSAAAATTMATDVVLLDKEWVHDVLRIDNMPVQRLEVHPTGNTLCFESTTSSSSSSSTTATTLSPENNALPPSWNTVQQRAHEFDGVISNQEGLEAEYVPKTLLCSFVLAHGQTDAQQLNPKWLYDLPTSDIQIVREVLSTVSDIPLDNISYASQGKTRRGQNLVTFRLRTTWKASEGLYTRSKELLAQLRTFSTFQDLDNVYLKTIREEPSGAAGLANAYGGEELFTGTSETYTMYLACTQSTPMSRRQVESVMRAIRVMLGVNPRDPEALPLTLVKQRVVDRDQLALLVSGQGSLPRNRAALQFGGSSLGWLQNVANALGIPMDSDDEDPDTIDSVADADSVADDAFVDANTGDADSVADADSVDNAFVDANTGPGDVEEEKEDSPSQATTVNNPVSFASMQGSDPNAPFSDPFAGMGDASHVAALDAAFGANTPSPTAPAATADTNPLHDATWVATNAVVPPMPSPPRTMMSRLPFPSLSRTSRDRTSRNANPLDVPDMWRPPSPPPSSPSPSDSATDPSANTSAAAAAAEEKTGDGSEEKTGDESSTLPPPPLWKRWWWGKRSEGLDGLEGAEVGATASAAAAVASPKELPEQLLLLKFEVRVDNPALLSFVTGDPEALTLWTRFYGERTLNRPSFHFISLRNHELGAKDHVEVWLRTHKQDTLPFQWKQVLLNNVEKSIYLADQQVRRDAHPDESLFPNSGQLTIVDIDVPHKHTFRIVIGLPANMEWPVSLMTDAQRHVAETQLLSAANKAKAEETRAEESKGEEGQGEASSSPSTLLASLRAQWKDHSFAAFLDAFRAILQTQWTAEKAMLQDNVTQVLNVTMDPPMPLEMNLLTGMIAASSDTSLAPVADASERATDTAAAAAAPWRERRLVADTDLPALSAMQHNVLEREGWTRMRQEMVSPLPPPSSIVPQAPSNTEVMEAEDVFTLHFQEPLPDTHTTPSTHDMVVHIAQSLTKWIADLRMHLPSGADNFYASRFPALDSQPFTAVGVEGPVHSTRFLFGVEPLPLRHRDYRLRQVSFRLRCTSKEGDNVSLVRPPEEVAAQLEDYRIRLQRFAVFMRTLLSIVLSDANVLNRWLQQEMAAVLPRRRFPLLEHVTADLAGTSASVSSASSSSSSSSVAAIIKLSGDLAVDASDPVEWKQVWQTTLAQVVQPLHATLSGAGSGSRRDSILGGILGRQGDGEGLVPLAVRYGRWTRSTFLVEIVVHVSGTAEEAEALADLREQVVNTLTPRFENGPSTLLSTFAGAPRCMVFAATMQVREVAALLAVDVTTAETTTDAWDRLDAMVSVISQELTAKRRACMQAAAATATAPGGNMVGESAVVQETVKLFHLDAARRILYLVVDNVTQGKVQGSDGEDANGVDVVSSDVVLSWMMADRASLKRRAAAEYGERFLRHLPSVPAGVALPTLIHEVVNPAYTRFMTDQCHLVVEFEVEPEGGRDPLEWAHLFAGLWHAKVYRDTQWRTAVCPWLVSDITLPPRIAGAAAVVAADETRRVRIDLAMLNVESAVRKAQDWLQRALMTTNNNNNNNNNADNSTLENHNYHVRTQSLQLRTTVALRIVPLESKMAFLKTVAEVEQENDDESEEAFFDTMMLGGAVGASPWSFLLPSSSTTATSTSTSNSTTTPSSKQQQRYLSYYATADVQLYPGTTIPKQEEEKLKCARKWNAVQKSWSALTGTPFQMKPLEVNRVDWRRALTRRLGIYPRSWQRASVRGDGYVPAAAAAAAAAYRRTRNRNRNRSRDNYNINNKVGVDFGNDFGNDFGKDDGRDYGQRYGKDFGKDNGNLLRDAKLSRLPPNAVKKAAIDAAAAVAAAKYRRK